MFSGQSGGVEQPLKAVQLLFQAVSITELKQADTLRNGSGEERADRCFNGGG